MEIALLYRFALAMFISKHCHELKRSNAKINHNRKWMFFAVSSFAIIKEMA